MALIDYAIIAVYLIGLIVIGLTRRATGSASAADFIVGGRRLTLPAFVATLVSSWYGGILGVGEYSFSYGISNWLVFGLPYYLAAFLFAVFLARKARRAEVLTIPDTLNAVYGRGPAVAGSIVLFIMTLPGAYILMLAVLVKFLFGWPLWIGALAGAVFSLFYVYLGGFRAVVRTDLLQFGLMFLGFIILFLTLVSQYGGFEYLKNNIPATHFTWHGGNPAAYIAVWYIIALATLIEPTFYQRCYAARSEGIAKRGIFISIGVWFVFDFLTTSCGLYARAILPDLQNPIASYPALAEAVLPAGLLGLFALAMIATVMSTIDSYSFIAASTFGRDIIWRIFKVGEDKITYYTRVGLFLSAALALIIALYFESIVTIWHDFGSVGTPILLIPLFFALNGRRRMSGRVVLISMISSGLLSLIWLILCYQLKDGAYLFGIPPIVPGLVASILFYLLGSKRLAKAA